MLEYDHGSDASQPLKALRVLGSPLWRQGLQDFKVRAEERSTDGLLKIEHKTWLTWKSRAVFLATLDSSGTDDSALGERNLFGLGMLLSSSLGTPKAQFPTCIMMRGVQGCPLGDCTRSSEVAMLVVFPPSPGH